ncbi:hypothetical protein DDE18_10105 [Nocardioides gansuensis]|uniref:AB hydrolase-1 domain-containing protein n=1 Tax=Nocardioides gansuensis TaxID=2138300 RepID=A0A2T8FAI5_9ACTN|nr:hypothetical protein DDE18_10105 [Nocardioides gansuensis]
MTTDQLLLLSGAGLPDWIWDEVRGRLDLPSVVAPVPPGATSLDDLARAALAAAEAERLHLVAHSAGGVVAAAVAALAPERVASVTGLSASVPAAGRSFAGALPFPMRHVIPLVVRLAGTRPSEKAIRGLCAGVDEATADRVVADFVPAPKALFLDGTPARTWPARRAYLLTERDTEFPVGLQETFAAELDAPVTRVATGHLPMLEAPEQVVALVAARAS